MLIRIIKKMEKLIEKNQSIIYYSVHGQGMPILLLHGFGMDSSIWHFQIESLQEKYLFIVPDLPGFGKSKTNFDFDYSFDVISDILQAILLKESIPKFIFIGHSMGAYIGLDFLNKYPEKILGLGLFHSTVYIDSELKKEKRKKSIEFIKRNNSAAFLEMLIPSLFYQKTNHIADIEKLIHNTSVVKEEVLIGYYHAILNRDENSSLLRNENMPYLFVAGLHDEVIPLNEILQQCHLPKQTEINILQSSGHMGMMEEKEKSTEILDNYFKQIQNKQDE